MYNVSKVSWLILILNCHPSAWGWGCADSRVLKKQEACWIWENHNFADRKHLVLQFVNTESYAGLELCSWKNTASVLLVLVECHFFFQCYLFELYNERETHGKGWNILRRIELCTKTMCQLNAHISFYKNQMEDILSRTPQAVFTSQCPLSTKH